MENERVLELLQELYNCKPATDEDLEEIKKLYESEIPFKIIDGKVWDESGTWVADVGYYGEE